MNREQRRAWGPLIRAAREAQRLTQDEVAEQANTSRRTLGSIERGDTVAQHEVLDRLLLVLGLAPQRLDSDVEAFMAMIGPLLQMLSAGQRLAVIPEITQLIAVRLTDVPADGGPSHLGAEGLPAAWSTTGAGDYVGVADRYALVADEDEYDIEDEQESRNEP